MIASASPATETIVIPLGYMFKVVAPPPDWMGTRAIDRVYSVSGHVSRDFLDYIPLWRHNGWWFFNSSATLRDIVRSEGLDAASLTLFYYEAFEKEYDEAEENWRSIYPEGSFVTNVEPPKTKNLCGYDVVTFSVHTSPECSPLSCNMLAREMSVNKFCLFDDFSTAHDLVEGGAFDHSEPGPYRIIAVYNNLFGSED